MISSLQVTPLRDSVRLVLQVTNAEPQPVELVFPSGQSYDFAILSDGRELWRWSAEMGFTQAVREVTLAPGETLTYAASWSPPAGLEGELTAVGALTSTTHPVERRATFRVP